MMTTKRRFWHLGISMICLFFFGNTINASGSSEDYCINANLSLYGQSGVLECSTAPVITCPTIYYGCVGDNVDPAQIGQATAIAGDSECDAPIVTYQDFVEVNEDCYYELHRLWTAKYPGSANPWLYADCTQIILLRDETAPAIGNCPSDITINTTGNCEGVAKWGEPVPTDNCGIQSFTSSHENGSAFPVGTTTVSFTAVDNCGYSASCSFNITVIGECCTTPPHIACPDNVSVCPSNGNGGTLPSYTGFAVGTAANGSCSNDIQVSYVDNVQAYGDCTGAKKITRTWTAYYTNNPTLSSTCTQIINVRDLIDPEISNLPSNISVEALPGQDYANVSWNEPSATDNCGISSFISSHNSGSSFGEGSTSVTYDAEDDCGNTTSLSFTVHVTIPDCQGPPVISCPSNKLRCPGSNPQFYHPDNTGYATATPAGLDCGAPIITYSDNIESMNGCPGGMQIYRTWKATDPDNAELFSTCLQMINLNDQSNPSVVSCPDNITVDADGTGNGANVSWNSPKFTDNCGIASVQNSHSSGSYFQLGCTTVTYTAYDNCGNAITCSFVVCVEDNSCQTAPIITCPPNSLRCPGSNALYYHPNSTGYASAVPGGANCGNPIITYSDSYDDMNGCAAGMKIFRTWTATDPDNAGLFSTCVQIINLNDAVSPVVQYCPSDVVVETTYGSGIAVTWPTAPSFTDNCGVESIQTTHVNGSTFGIGTTTVTYTAIDKCGNTATCSFNVIVVDVACSTPPVITCPSNKMRCPGSNSNGYHPNSTGYATAVAGGANCGTPVVTYADVFDTMAGCSGGSKIYRTWTAMDPDNMSLISTCTQIINLNDPASPTVTSCTDNISVPATSSNGAIVNYAVPSFGDNCGLASIIGSHSSGDLFPVGTTPVTYTAEDLCGNTVSCSFNISVSTPSCDVAPVISCPSDKVLCLNDSYTPSVTGYATASTSGAHCADPVVTYSDVVINSGPCTGQKIIKRTWTATDPDNSFLSSSCEQIIELKDSGVPVITSCPQDIAVDGGPWCDAAVTWEAPTATDDCGIVDVTSNYTSGTVFGGGSTQVVYTFTDACGNSTSCSFNIIVSCGNIGCSVTPIINCPSDVNNICVGNSVSPSVTGYATASPGLPACDDPVVSYTDVVMSQGNCAGAQVLKRIWRAEDPNDSSIFATCEQIISTVDNQPPTFVYCPDDVTVDGGAWCDAIVTWGPVSATDNCGLPDLDSNYSSGHVFNEGVTEVTYTATDACGNTSTCWFSVTVTCSNPCNTPPNINCPASVTLCPGSNYDPSVTGTATATPSGSCGNTIDIIYTDYIVSTGPCASEKVIHRTWTAKDQMDPSLQSSCVQTISLVDNVPPGIWECPSDITVEYGQPAIWFEPSADDNCGVPSFVSTHNNGSIFSQGTTEVTYTATDNCGNVALCSFTVTVPGPSANFECPNDIVVQCNANGGAPVTWDPPVYSGTCGNCDGGYIDGFIYMGSYNGHQYYCSTSPANWPTANAVCNANGGYLASVNNAGENAFLANILTTQSAWIGLNDAAQEGVFNWTNGDPFNYNNWYPGQPNDYNADQDYVEMLADGTWNDQYNIKQLEYIMEVPCQSVIQIAGPEPGSYLAAGNYEVVYKLHDSCGNATCSFDITVESSISMLCPDDVTLSCPVNETGLYVNWQSPVATSCCQDCSLGGVIDGFVYMGSFNGHYYYCSTAPATWPNANSSAQANGGYLAAINSPEENNFLANLLTIQSAYIGLNDAGSEGNFSWSNGDPLGFHNWYPGQPNDFNGFQDYVELLNNGEWNDQYNDKPLEYIMEIPGCIDVHQIAGPASGTFFHSNTTTTVTYQATDNCGNLTTCSFDVTVVKNECNSGGLDSGVCWIEGVKVGDIYNVTGNDGGYADYTDICTTIQPGVSYPLALGPWCQSTQYKVFWKIWIDFNMDGDYNDNGEFIAYGSAAGEISGSFTVPTTGVWSGTTTMRVAMKVGEFPTGPCEEFQYGETEDYCVEIVGADLKGEDETSSRSKDDTEYEVAILTGKELINHGVEVFPNPATDYLNIMLESSDQILDASIFAADGKMIKQLDVIEADSQISLDGMRTGIYFLNVRYNDGTLESARFIIQE